MADYSGLSSSVFAGPDVTGARPNLLDRVRNARQPTTNPMLNLPRPALPAVRNQGVIQGNRFNPFPGQDRNPAPRIDPQAPLTFSQTPRSQTQNQFLQAVTGQAKSAQPIKQGALTNFVRQAYANQATDKQALDEERKMLDKIFAQNGGLVDELANSRARKTAGIMLRTKMALDRAKRSNNVNRMLGGNNTYNDRLYAQALAGIGANSAINAADMERDDLRYITGLRTGALGVRGRLGQDYLSTLMRPAQAQNDAMRDDLSVLEQIARLENSNSVYESPLDQIRRELETRRGLSALDFYE